MSVSDGALRRARASAPDGWGASAEEVDDSYPCEKLVEGDYVALTRAVDVDAPSAVTFRWLCQLREAPYSYDWVDNRGRRSPHELTPGLDRLEVGQTFQVVRLTSFVADQHITGRATPAARTLFGLVSLTYRVAPRGRGGSRLVTRLVVRRPHRLWEKARFVVLAWGDLVMMRKQLLTLKKLSEGQAG